MVGGRATLIEPASRPLAPARGGQLGVGAFDQLGGAVLCRERGESDLDLAPIGVGRERDLDRTEALTGILDRRA